MKESKHKVLARLTALLLALVLVVALGVSAMAAQTEPEEPVCYNHGDVNGDEVIDNRDAIYTLYRVIFGDEEYPVAQDWDFNKDNEKDNKDAIYLLYAYMFSDDPDYHLDGEVHGYYDPSWKWTETTNGMKAEVTFKCTCSEPHTLGAADGVAVKELSKKAAGCFENGYVEYQAKVTFEGKEYTATHKQELLTAGAHRFVGAQSCMSGVTCADCGAKLEALGHSWVLDEEKSEAATCTEQGVQVYVCRRQGCQAEKREDTEKTPHMYEMAQEVHEEGTCKYTEQFRCVCGATKSGNSYYVHTYSAKLTKEANCKETGIKTHTCSVCGDPYDETVPVNDSHDWDDGVTANGITTFTCKRTGCGATKKAVCVAENEATVSKDALKENELQLGSGASLDLDADTLDGLTSSDVVIKVEQVDKNTLQTDQALLDQIGGDFVYNFNLSAGGNAVSEFAGKITISLPYELQPGDDVDNISVWYIDDEGVPTSIKATYSNGFVTFETDHFSYYTVTRLTPEERCELYGHTVVNKYLAPTCTSQGYDIDICQRCGKTEKNKTLFTLPHAYNFSKKAATCEQDGYQEKKCPDCGLTVKTILSKLDHDLQLNKEKSVAASCTAAGKEVYTCGNSGCSYVQEKPLAQLAHNYKCAETVAATCTAKGYEKYACASCKDEQIRNEQAPLGHKYEAKNVAWTWSEDHATATATLRCSHDLTHTRTATAVVTQKTESATCLSGGAVTYTATASYNMVTFTDKVVVTTGTASHKTDSQWTTNANQHYHICQSCNGKVDAADHNWSTETTVIKEATCVSNGVAGVKCTVCGYVKETVIPATGEHDLVYGKCRNCDFEEDICTHIRMYEKKLDLSKFNICAGAEINHSTCDCGEQSYVDYYNLPCDFEFSEQKPVQTENLTTITQSGTCKDCGLKLSMTQGFQIDTKECIGRYFVDIELSMGNTVIIKTHFEPESEVEMHPATKVLGTVDLTDAKYGLCGEVLTITSCPCGQETSYEVDTQCDWEWVHGTMDGETWECRSCGAVKEETRKEEKGELPCQIVRHYVVTYTVGSKEVYSYTNTSAWFDHNDEVIDYEMMGETCLDGVYVKGACLDCGEPYEDYYTYHKTVKTVKTDLSSYDFCASAHLQHSCLCGVVNESELVYDDSDCWWQIITIDEEAGLEVYTCWKCGVTKKIVTAFSEKDEYCSCMKHVTITYTDANNNVIVTGFTDYEAVNHDYSYEYELMGESCEEGVLVTVTCADCGEIYDYEDDYHIQSEHKRYDLTQFGACYDYVELTSCPCGERASIEFQGGKECRWQRIKGGRNYYVAMCTECGIVKTERNTYEQLGESCQWEDTINVILSRGEKELLNISFSQIREQHRIVHTVKLNEGATSCEDGYTVTASCVGCGMNMGRVSYPEEGNAHRLWIKDRELVIEGELCGDIELITGSCACGKETQQDMQWIGIGCDFYENDKGYYDPKLETRVYVCTTCGAEMWQEQERTKVEGETCKTQYTNTYHYRKGGKDLGGFTSITINDDHTYLFSFDLQGNQSCEDGYYVTATCRDCGENWSEEPEYWDWHNESCLVEVETLLDVEGICGKIENFIYSCACGQNNHMEESDSCQWIYVPNDGKEEGYFNQCQVCGLLRHTVQKSEYDRENCKRVDTITRTYSLNDKVLNTVTTTQTYEDHAWEHSFQLMGETCEDGYYVTKRCAVCEETRTDSEPYFGYEVYTLKYIDLSSFDVCGGYVEEVGCACGETKDWAWDLHCDYQHVDNANVQPNTSAVYCADCNTYVYYYQNGQQNPSTCRYEGSYGFKVVRNDEVLLDATGPINREEHAWTEQSYGLMNPDGTCENGVRVNYICLNPSCGQTSQDTYYHHEQFIQEEFNLTDLGDMCGGVIYKEGCACGQSSRIRWEEACEDTTDTGSGSYASDGTWHGHSTTTCRACGLTVEWKTDEKKQEGSCEGVRVETVTAKLGDEEKCLSAQVKSYIHAFGDYIYALETPGTSCEDGLTLTRICADCQTQQTGFTRGHSYNIVSSVDLAEHGSVCGGKLNLLKCPCGKYQRYELDDQTKCDLDDQWVEPWIVGILNDNQLTSEGAQSYSYSTYSHICSVTNPAECGLSMKSATYWKKEGCMAIEYQTWVLDDDTELTIATGYKLAYHNYGEPQTKEETLADGTSQTTRSYVCADCQSTATCILRQKNGWECYRYEYAVNKLSNGENKEYTREVTYADNFNGYLFVTLDRVDYIKADGRTGWNQHAYTNDFSSGCCSGTYQYSDSNGNSYGGKTEVHKGQYFQNVTNSTCSQPGAVNYGYKCVACETKYNEGSYELKPQHSWCEPVDGIYTCSICGLESANNASGVIVMEDLTEKLGGGTHYVVGYYKKEDLQIMVNVSLILDNVAEGENDQIILQEEPEVTWLTKENDGVCAVKLNKEQVDAMLAAALPQDYTGTYALRIAMIPVGGSELDYAITFDSVEKQ